MPLKKHCSCSPGEQPGSPRAALGTEEEERRGTRACRGEEGTTTGRAHRQGVPLWGPRIGTGVGPPGLAQASSCSSCAVTRWTLHWSRSRALHACPPELREEQLLLQQVSNGWPGLQEHLTSSGFLLSERVPKPQIHAINARLETVQVPPLR